MRFLVVLGTLAAIQVVDARPSRAELGYYYGTWCAQI